MAQTTLLVVISMLGAGVWVLCFEITHWAAYFTPLCNR